MVLELHSNSYNSALWGGKRKSYSLADVGQDILAQNVHADTSPPNPEERALRCSLGGIFAEGTRCEDKEILYMLVCVGSCAKRYRSEQGGRRGRRLRGSACVLDCGALGSRRRSKCAGRKKINSRSGANVRMCVEKERREDRVETE